MTSATTNPLVLVCAGGGGVGKTSTSAALALALARAGRRTLVVSIDPARRLAGAMGIELTDEVREAALPEAGGRLFALMPDPRRSLGTFVSHLFEDDREARARVLGSGLYRALADAAAGVHELVAMNLVARAAQHDRFDALVIDTAPSRHAIDFVTYPARLSALLGGRAVAGLADLARKQDEAAAGGDKRGGGLLSWGADRVEALVARVTGPTLVRDTAALFADLSRVRERFVELTERASALLLGERSTYLLVGAPSGAARDDVLYLAQRLQKLGRAPRAVLLNRADTHAAPWAVTLRASGPLPGPVSAALDALERERATREVAADAFSRELAKKLAKVPLLRLPHVEATEPAAVVAALSHELDGHLARLAP